ncbi:MAG: MarR family transcriptional regulator [Anaerolineales bacterium]
MPADPFVATLQRWVGVSMRRSMRNIIQYSRKSGLSMSHLGALFHIHGAGSCGVTEIGDHLGVTGGAASQLIDRLVGQGLVLRDVDPQDRRVKRIELTELGEHAMRDGVRARQRWVEDVAETLTKDEKEEITRALEILIARVESLAEEPAATH